MIRDTNRLQNSRFFFSSKSVKKSVKRGVRVLSAKRAREKREKSVSPQSRFLFSTSFQTFRLTARAYFNTQKYGVSCCLGHKRTQTFKLHKYAL